MNAVTIQKSWIEAAGSLPDDRERGQFFTAICHYALSGEVLPLTGTGKIYFELIKNEIAKSQKRRIAQEKSSAKRAENSLQNSLQNDLQNDLQNTGNAGKKENPPAPPKEKTKKRDTNVSPKESGLSFEELIPASLKTVEFEIAWDQWCRYRKGIRHKLSKLTALKQLQMLGRYPPAIAVAAIDESIRNGWQGLFPEKTVMPPPTIHRDHTGV